MSIISGLTERAGILLAVASRKMFDVHGRIETRKHRARNVIPLNGDRIDMEVGGDNIAEIDGRIVRLLTFIDHNQLDTLVIIGSAYGRELVPLSKRTKIRIIGADLSQKAIDACIGYGLPNTAFHVTNLEDLKSLAALWAAVDGKAVGVYCCETAPYILPEKLQAFLSTLPPKVRAVQFFEATHIDYASKWAVGAPFSYRDNHWRHNYYAMLVKAGFAPYRNDYIMRNGPVNQPMWLIAANCETPIP